MTGEGALAGIQEDVVSQDLRNEKRQPYEEKGKRVPGRGNIKCRGPRGRASMAGSRTESSPCGCPMVSGWEMKAQR